MKNVGGGGGDVEGDVDAVKMFLLALFFGILIGKSVDRQMGVATLIYIFIKLYLANRTFSVNFCVYACESEGFHMYCIHVECLPVLWCGSMEDLLPQYFCW